VTPASLRKKLGLSRVDWARALNVNERTVMRWENEGDAPGGLAAAVLRGIEGALAEGAEPARVGRLVGMGIHALVYRGLTEKEVR
jgi:transcriptional regulator with XRE-family HTH domain